MEEMDRWEEHIAQANVMLKKGIGASQQSDRTAE
jgi:hypothetical protein